MKQWVEAGAWRWELREGEIAIAAVGMGGPGFYYGFYGSGYEYLGEFQSLKAAKRAVERRAERENEART